MPEVTSHVRCCDGVPWRVGLSPLRHLAALCAYFAGFAVWSTGCILAARHIPSAAFVSGRWTIFAGSQACGLAAMLAVICAAPPRGCLAGKLGLRVPGRGDWTTVLLGLAAAYLFQFVTTPLWTRVLRMLHVECEKRQELLRMCEGLGVWGFVGVVLLLGVLVPVSEEVIYRRIVFGAFRPLGTLPALVVASLVFSLMHAYLYGFWALWAIGVAFQWIYLRSRNLGAAVAAHMIFNTVTLVAVFFTGAK